MAAKEGPATRFILVTKGEALALGPCRALCCGSAGTVNLTQIDGTERDNYPLQTGYNPIEVSEVRVGGTADDIWALY
jgi:hypothetical protein